LTDPTYRGFVARPMQINGKSHYVGVHLALVDDRLVCIGIDLRAVNLGELAGQPIDLGNGEWLEITTSVLRGLPLGEAVDRALAEHRLVTNAGPACAQDRGVTTAPSPRTTARSVPRGPLPLLDDTALATIVAPAYRMGGRRPVRAVLEALSSAGALPSPVTIDQARRAVVRARARGFIPPARTSSTANQEGRR
jgi:hypothetical protein